MKIGYFITARLKSSRLRKKIALPLNGDTVLDHVINRCKLVNNIDDVVLCTSINSQDSQLYDYALNHKIKFYAGSEDDVLKRLLDAAKYYGFDAFVSITADNPLHSYYLADLIVDWYKKEPSDFIFTSGVPIGIAPYFITTKALEVAVEMKKDLDTEIWGPFVNRPDFFKIGYLNVETNLFPKNPRLTCDYIEDYLSINEIYRNFPMQYNPSLFEISNLISSNKVLMQNTNTVQSNLNKDVITEIQSTFDENKNKGKKFAEQLGFKLYSGENHLTIKI